MANEQLLEFIPHFLHPGASRFWFGVLYAVLVGLILANLSMYWQFPDHWAYIAPMSGMIVMFSIGVILLTAGYANSTQYNPQAAKSEEKQAAKKSE